MKFAALIVAMLLAAGVAGEAAAHAVVIGTSLAAEPIAAGHATHVLMRFNSGIEIGLSRAFLVSKGDHFQQLTIARGEKPGELLVDVPALVPGDYALKFRILAADGHVTEDVLRFQVKP